MFSQFCLLSVHPCRCMSAAFMASDFSRLHRRSNPATVSFVETRFCCEPAALSIVHGLSFVSAALSLLFRGASWSACEMPDKRRVGDGRTQQLHADSCAAHRQLAHIFAPCTPAQISTATQPRHSFRRRNTQAYWPTHTADNARRLPCLCCNTQRTQDALSLL